MSKLVFRSLSVLDFIEESKRWDADHFIPNVTLHKEELKKLDVDNEESPFYGCGREIWHLIDFCRKIIYFNQYNSEPGGISEEDFNRLKEIFRRYGVNV